MNNERLKQLESRLLQLDLERSQVVEELLILQATELAQPMTLVGRQASSKTPETSEDKISLFLSLFRCRKSVYPKLWENQKQDRKGYSPVCNNEWARDLCGKPPQGKIKCSECPNQAFPELDELAVKNHLQGQHTIGTYAITKDDLCTFLAADFDGDGWQVDVMAYKKAALSFGVHAHVERSRSGKGGHAWVFFTGAIPAKSARRLGTAILSRTLQDRHALSLKSYDRFFPNQDFLPKGGFGNLIALPLQQKARENGSSVFVDEKFDPFPNQWEYLAQVRRLSISEVENIVQQVLPKAESTENMEPEYLSMETDERLMRLAKPKIIKGLFSGNVEIEQGAQLKIQIKSCKALLWPHLKERRPLQIPSFMSASECVFKLIQNHVLYLMERSYLGRRNQCNFNRISRPGFWLTGAVSWRRLFSVSSHSPFRPLVALLPV